MNEATSDDHSGRGGAVGLLQGAQRLAGRIRSATFLPPNGYDAGGRVLRAWRARLVVVMLHLSILVSFTTGIGKLVSGGMMQPYILANAIVSVGAAIAKIVILVGAGHALAEHGRHVRIAGAAMLTSITIYLVGCAVATASGSFAQYTRESGIVVAICAFVEVGSGVVGAISFRRAWTPLLHANKLIGLASGLVALALTQTAILSFSSHHQEIAPTNAAFSFLMGLLALGIGLVLVTRRAV